MSLMLTSVVQQIRACIQYYIKVEKRLVHVFLHVSESREDIVFVTVAKQNRSILSPFVNLTDKLLTLALTMHLARSKFFIPPIQKL